MSRQEVADKIRQAISQELAIDIDKIQEDSHLLGDLDIDSFDLITAMMKIEDEFDISIPDEDAQAWTTVKSVVDYVMEAKGSE